MSEEKNITSEEEDKGKESNNLDQDDISKLIDEMQSEEISSATDNQVEKTTDEGKKGESDEIKDDQREESTTLNQDDISRLEVQNEDKSSESEKREEQTENNVKDNEDKKNDENEMMKDEKTETAKSNDKVEEKATVNKEDGREKDETPEKKIDEEDNNGFKSLDSEDEVEIDGDLDSEANPETDPEFNTEPGTEKDKNENEDNGEISKKENDDKNKETEKGSNSSPAVKTKMVKKKTKGKNFTMLISCISIIACIAVLLGLYAFFKKTGDNNKKSEESFESEQIRKLENKNSEGETTDQIKYYENKNIILNNSIFAKLDEIADLRDELLIKEKEIAELVQNYKSSISEMEDEILRVKQNFQISSFGDAIKNKKIEFSMMTIQRCLAYIEKIEQPYRWLNQGSEELLYLKRKIEIDSRISRVINGIDMDKIIKEADIVIQSYRNGIEKLEIEMKNVNLMPLETIWERLISKKKFAVKNNKKNDDKFEKKKTALRNEEINNRVIWEEICSGNYKRKNEMTNLSIEAAKCLSRWKHVDLFLNELLELSPDVAKHLLKWEGNWICLNGVKKLSSEAAKYLFQWQGNWISLNGISEISSGLLMYLPQWKGKQLELMGLKYKKTRSEIAGLEALAKWKKAGGKLYVPAQIRKVIEKL